MSERHLNTVRNRLKRYAERGALRQFDEKPLPRGKRAFRFEWLHDKPFTVVADTHTGKLTLKNALPNVPARSSLDRDVRAFIASRSDSALPAHRKVDPKRAEMSCTNRAGAVSLTLTVKNNQYAYGTTKLLNVANELFGVIEMRHSPYLWKEFDLPEE